MSKHLPLESYSQAVSIHHHHHFVYMYHVSRCRYRLSTPPNLILQYFCGVEAGYNVYWSFLLSTPSKTKSFHGPGSKWGVHGPRVHVLCSRHKSKWLAHPELVPEFVIKTIILLNNVYLHLVYCSFLRLYFLSFEGDMHPVHYRGSMGPWAWSI